MELRIEVDSKKILAALAKAPEEFSKEMRDEMTDQTTAVQNEARRVHRYILRSGNLARSVTTKVAQSGLSAEVRLETGIAKYGPAIHEGWSTRNGKTVKRGWRADKFLNSALENQKDNIQRGFVDALQRGFKKAGL